MQTFTTKLGDGEAIVYAPEKGSFDKDAFNSDFPPGQTYGLDVEGCFMTGLKQFAPDFNIRLIQFATIGFAWVLDLTDPAQRDAAIKLLADETVWFCSHTNMDVLSVYTQLGVDITKRNWDTHTLATMAAPDDMDGGKDLKTLAAKYGMNELVEAESVMHGKFRELWNAWVKAQRAQGVKGLSVCNTGMTEKVQAYAWSAIPSDDPAYLLYAGLDAVVARRLLEILITEGGAPAELLETEQWLAGASNRLQIRGALVDRTVLDELHAEAQAATEAANEKVRAITGLNVTQRAKLIDWFGENGVDWSAWSEHGGEMTKPSKNNPNGNPSIAKKNIFVLKTFDLTEDGFKVVDAMIEAQQHADALTKTQGVLDALGPDNRVHSTLLTVGTVTGRMASKGPNMQNFSKKDQRVRGMFVPAPGNVLISCDFSQVELRVVAALAGETSMVEAVLQGVDLHQHTADKLGITRDLAKTLNFLILYGGGPTKFAASSGLTKAKGIEIIENFWASYPAIEAYNQEMIGMKQGVRTISYRYVPIGWYIDEERGIRNPKYYKNLNSQVQSSARDLIVDAWWRLEHEFGMGDLVWGLIHDEMVLEVPEDRVDEALKAVQTCMTMEFLGVPIAAEASVLRDGNGVSRWMK
jgi:DNA polymerase-1